ncbi:MAG: M23 family metallopeptidase [Chloroflexi bacterium]|nr:M23 family metallopeptidase [Chloroflexota bacterium]
MENRSCVRTLFLIFVGLVGLFLIALIFRWENNLGGALPLPIFPTTAPYTSWPTPPVATEFDYPLLPIEDYGSLLHTRYGKQNPSWGNRSNCFRDAGGGTISFSQLYHAGIDLFVVNSADDVVWGSATHAPVYAVADGVTVFVVDAGSEGQIVAIEHRLVDGSTVYSIYWHVGHIQVQPGQPVTRGQMIAALYDMGMNSHLHWEMRTFYDGSNMFPVGTAGARGTCNRQIAGVGYTWDDLPARAHPDFYGYLDPVAFVESRRP